MSVGKVTMTQMTIYMDTALDDFIATYISKIITRMMTVGLLMTLNRIAHERVGGGKEGRATQCVGSCRPGRRPVADFFLLDIHKIRNLSTLIYWPIKNFHFALQAIN